MSDLKRDNIQNEYILKILDTIEPYQIETTKSGNKTFSINNIAINSKYDPIKEADKLFENFKEKIDETDVLILYGNGAGYFFKKCYEYISALNKKPYILFIEKDIRIFRTLLSIIDISQYINDEKVKFFIDAEKELIGSFLQQIPTKRIKYYNHRPTYFLNEKYYRELQNHLEYILDRKDMNNATFSKFQRLWNKNIIYNSLNIDKYQSINNLKQICSGCTAIVVAGGPSLDATIDWIKEHNDKLIVVAVDTVVSVLKKNNIQIDIIVSVDPQYWNYKYLENIKIENEILVTDISTYHKILMKFQADHIFIPDSIFPMGKYFQGNKSYGVFGTGGSVATTAFDIARIIGADQIIIAGLDLSFPNRHTHFKGAFFENNFLYLQTYFDTAETRAYQYLAHIDMLPVKYNDGRIVSSDQKMFLFKKWFDREIPLSSQKVYMFKSCGISIDGINNIEKSNLLLHNITKKITLSKIDINQNEPRNPNFKIKYLLDSCKSIKVECLKLLSLIPEKSTFEKIDINSIEKIEKRLFENPDLKIAVDILSSAAQDILLSIREEYEFDDSPIKSLWLKTRAMYNAISELADYFSVILLKVLNKTNKVTDN